MSIFNLFRREGKNRSDDDDPQIEFGFRGEGLIYQWANKRLLLEYTWIDGPRIYPENIVSWEDRSALTDDEKRKVFVDVLRFLCRKRKSPIVVINTDDSSKEHWESLCSANRGLIKGTEYTSNQERSRVERDMFVRFIQAGKSVSIAGIEITSETELDEFLRKRSKHPTA